MQESHSSQTEEGNRVFVWGAKKHVNTLAPRHVIYERDSRHWSLLDPTHTLQTSHGREARM